jgi:hypothetical protein
VVVWPSTTGAPVGDYAVARAVGSHQAGAPGSSGLIVTSPDVAAISTLGVMRGRRIAVGIYTANSKSRMISGATLAMIPE